MVCVWCQGVVVVPGGKGGVGGVRWRGVRPPPRVGVRGGNGAERLGATAVGSHLSTPRHLEQPRAVRQQRHTQRVLTLWPTLAERLTARGSAREVRVAKRDAVSCEGLAAAFPPAKPCGVVRVGLAAADEHVEARHKVAHRWQGRCRTQRQRAHLIFSRLGEPDRAVEKPRAGREEHGERAWGKHGVVTHGRQLGRQLGLGVWC